MKNKGKRSSFGMGRLFIIVLDGILGLVIWGMYNKSTGSASDKLIPGSSDNHPHVFSYAPDGETVWLGTHTGVYEWKDTKWQRTLPPLSQDDVMGLEIDASNPQHIMVSGHGFVKRTVDGGETWETAENGLPNQPKPDVPDAHQLTMNLLYW
ncbi:MULTISPECIES: hypothetical protein [unclassified Paenibacillus]|uniref:hypothetical protein n=1 Tax=unclassified Paenibacillus TaxID=185978 RepID=UPI001AE72D2F|nr:MULTISPECIES: hypothetical protein [unclassified Paenibacillus]MBP1156966.1 hypothetical protein [Paenibacillus sp. PvP091]MBP1172295.1 hypothetical protein [Paenibacillus sp. PvR098]MBP2438676.1 hypothetical protein [Paenibacillus sp. PvP052]